MSEQAPDIGPSKSDKKRLKKVRNALIGGMMSVGAIGAQQAASAHEPRPVAAEPVVNVAPQAPIAPPSTENEQTLLEAAEWLPEKVRNLWPEIEQIANKYQQDPKLIATFVAEESGGNENAYNASGATGLLQIMPVTAEFIAKQRHISAYDMRDPKQNLDFGAWYLQYIDRQYLQPRGLDSSTYIGRSIYYVAMSGGVGSLENFLRSGYNMQQQSPQTQHVSELWEHMIQDWDQPRSVIFEQERGR